MGHRPSHRMPTGSTTGPRPSPPASRRPKWTPARVQISRAAKTHKMEVWMGKPWEYLGKCGKTMGIYGKNVVTVKTGWVLSSWLMGDIYWLFLNLKFKVSDLWCVNLHFHSLGSIMQFWRGCCRAYSRPILCFFCPGKLLKKQTASPQTTNRPSADVHWFLKIKFSRLFYNVASILGKNRQWIPTQFESFVWKKLYIVGNAVANQPQVYHKWLV